MRILWLAHMLPYPPTGGSLLRTHHLLRVASGFARVELLAFLQKRLLPPDVPLSRAVEALEEFCSVGGVFEIPFEAGYEKVLLASGCALSGKSYTTHWTYSRKYAAAVLERIGRGNHDLLVLDTIGLARNLPQRVALPIVLNHHNEEVSMLRQRSERSRGTLERRFFRREAESLLHEYRRFFPRVAEHLVTSELDRRRLQEIAPDASVQVVPNGVDTKAHPYVFRRGGGDSFTILFVGGGTWYPNREAIRWLVEEIWPLLATRIPSARLVIVGRAPTKESLRAAREDARVSVPGYVDDIVPWAAASDVFICPMKDGGGTRLKVLHALSLGLPIVSTKLGMEGIEARAAEHYVEAETTERFVSELARLAQDAGERERLSRVGRELVTRCYDWSVVGERVRRSFEALAAPGRGVSAT